MAASPTDFRGRLLTVYAGRCKGCCGGRLVLTVAFTSVGRRPVELHLSLADAAKLVRGAATELAAFAWEWKVAADLLGSLGEAGRRMRRSAASRVGRLLLDRAKAITGN